MAELGEGSRAMTQTSLEEIDLFDAAVRYACKNRKLNAGSEADPEKSRSTGTTFVLTASDGRVIDRIPLDKLAREAKKKQTKNPPDIGKILPAISRVASIIALSALLIKSWHSLLNQKPIPSSFNTPSELEQGPDPVPAGWKATDHAGIYWRWCPAEDRNCTASKRSGEHGSVLAQVWCKERACGNIYARVSLISDTGVVVGWTNDTTYGESGQVVQLNFSTNQPDWKKAQLTELRFTN